MKINSMTKAAIQGVSLLSSSLKIANRPATSLCCAIPTSAILDTRKRSRIALFHLPFQEKDAKSSCVQQKKHQMYEDLEESWAFLYPRIGLFSTPVWQLFFSPHVEGSSTYCHKFPMLQKLGLTRWYHEWESFSFSDVPVEYDRPLFLELHNKADCRRWR